MQELDQQGKFSAVKQLYHNSLFFKTLIDNCEMAMKKCFFPLTAFLATHPDYGEIWQKIYEEYELTQRYIFLLSGKNLFCKMDYSCQQQNLNSRVIGSIIIESVKIRFIRVIRVPKKYSWLEGIYLS